MPDHVQVMTTTGTRDDADRIARTLVDERLAACVQIVGPITSTYRWQGAIETSQEWLCLIKTQRDAYPEVEQAIRKLHPYQVPEILAMPIVAGNPAYLSWIDTELKR